MLTKNVYIGTIKQCLDVGNYKLYGDLKEYKTSKICGKRNYIIELYSRIMYKDVIVIKVNKDYYIDVNDVKNDVDLLLYPIKNLYKTKPEEDDELFIDKKSLVPYFKEESPKRIKVKQLKKIINEKN